MTERSPGHKDKDPIGQNLSREKARRNDVAEYRAEQLVRQAIINNYVLAFAESEIYPGGLVVDACAGPEGAVWPALLKGFVPISNDISLPFAKILKKTGAPKVVVSEFPNTPYRTNSADAALFIFALNNIVDTRGAFRETDRFLNDEGVIVTADPGPTIWVTNIMLYSVLTNEFADDPHAKLLLERSRFATKVSSFFEDREYTADEYCDHFRKGCLGISRQKMVDLLKELLSEIKLDNVPFYFQSAMAEEYFKYIERNALELGYEVKKRGLIVAGKKQDGYWEITEPYSLNQENWVNQITATRKLKGEIGNSLSQTLRRSKMRLNVPILVFKKVE